MRLDPNVWYVHAFGNNILSRDFVNCVLFDKFSDLFECIICESCSCLCYWVYFSLILCSKQKTTKNTLPFAFSSVSSHHNQIDINWSSWCSLLTVSLLELRPIHPTLCSVVFAFYLFQNQSFVSYFHSLLKECFEFFKVLWKSEDISLDVCYYFTSEIWNMFYSFVIWKVNQLFSILLKNIENHDLLRKAFLIIRSIFTIE